MDEVKRQALSEIILPPGSTSTDLQAAIDSAASGDTMIISEGILLDITGPNTITIPAGKEITIQSDADNNWELLQQNDYTPHFTVQGILNLSNITLDLAPDRTTVTFGGIDISGDGSRLILNAGVIIQNCLQSGVHGYSGGEFIMNDGAVIQNCISSRGGGVNMVANCRFIMNGGSILNCRASGNEPGGGVYIESNCTFVMNGGLISGCYSESSGGGVAVAEYSTFTMTGGTIRDNSVIYNGGGVAIRPYYSNFIMTGGTIMGNVSSNGNGAGIYINWGCTGNIGGESYIIKNTASNGSGGGIYIDEDADYSRLITARRTTFSCNVAQAAYRAPEGVAELYPNIEFASTSVADHPLNNYDINYAGNEPIEVTFHVTYNANGGRGKYVGPEVSPGNTDTALLAADIGIERFGFEFTVWNTQPDGSGTSYAPGDAITLDCSTVLFAQWTLVYTITYRPNGGRGGYIDHCREFEVYYAILSTNQTGISRSGFIFTGWNTEPDGSGIFYAQGEVIAVSGDIILYAQWRRVPAPKRRCRAPAVKCRKAIEGQKIWVDNDNAGDTRPSSVEIILLRDGEVYKRTNVDSAGDGYFAFCCLPIWKSSSQKYNYQIDEMEVPGYTKTIEGYNVINTLTP